jgi:hypothetical protein
MDIKMYDKEVGARKKASHYWNILFFFIILLAGLIVIFFTIYLITDISLLFYSAIIIGVILLSLCGHYYRKYTTWNIGASGEETVIRVLEDISGPRFVINDVMKPDGTNIDHVLLRWNGIFVIETKNVNGKITCNGDYWHRTKTGRQGTQYEGRIGSPSKQAKGNALFLSKLIQGHSTEIFGRPNVKVWVNAIVMFTNYEAEVNATNPTVPIVRPGELRRVIEGFSQTRLYTNEELLAMKRVIERNLV